VRADGPPPEVLTGPLLTEVYGHPVDVIEHDGNLVVVPVRSRVPELDQPDDEEVRCATPWPHV
jgi:iron complex transport system ATP-binding protein